MSSGQRKPAEQHAEDRDPGQWDNCGPGVLTKMVGHVDARQRWARRKQVLNTALVSTAVFACVVLALGTFMDRGGTHYGGIPCSVCRDHLAAYQSHVTGELLLEDPELITSLQVHLEKCTFCRGKFNARYPDSPLVHASTRRAVLVAMRPRLAVHSAAAMY